MSNKANLNKIIKSVQYEHNITRTAAIQRLAERYGLSYVTLHAVAKHSRMPKRKASADNVNKLIKELK